MNEKKMVQWKRRSEQKEKKHEIICVYLQGRFYYKEKKTSLGHLNVPDNAPWTLESRVLNPYNKSLRERHLFQF